MNRTRPFRPFRSGRRLARFLVALATALLTAAAAAPAAFAVPVPPSGGRDGSVLSTPSVQTIVVGGMPGWQIALIAIGAAVGAAAVAVFLDRARTGRRHQAAPGT